MNSPNNFSLFKFSHLESLYPSGISSSMLDSNIILGEEAEKTVLQPLLPTLKKDQILMRYRRQSTERKQRYSSGKKIEKQLCEK